MEKELLIQAIKDSISKTEVLKKLGLKNNGGNFNTLTFWLKKYELDTSNLIGRSKSHNLSKNFTKILLSSILVENSLYTSSNHLKERLYKEDLKKRECELCGQGELWKGKHMSLILDHINGVSDDNRIENLRIVCPNCNGTLETHCRGDRYIKKEKIKKEIKKVEIIRESKQEKEERLKKRRKVERPTYEQLLKEIKELGYTGTGRKYNVSDNSIRDWLKWYKEHENN